MSISPAFAAHGVADTGSSGGGIALLIILAVAAMAAVVYLTRKRWGKPLRGKDRSGE